MLGEQRGEGSRARVIRIDSGLYDLLVEWAQVEQVPLKACVDAVLWQWFTKTSKVPVARQEAMNRVRMATGAKRERLEANIRKRRWVPRKKPQGPPPIPIPTVGLMPKPSTKLPME